MVNTIVVTGGGDSAELGECVVAAAVIDFNIVGFAGGAQVQLMSPNWSIP